MSDRPPQLVLDVTAIAAWTRGSVAVGELLAEIDRDHGSVIVPLPCLIRVAATALDEDKQWLDLLVHHPAAVVRPDDPGDWRMLAEAHRIVGSAPVASAAWHALTHGIDVLTRTAKPYEGLGGDFLLLFDG
ncbi:hypothetical protein [Symbioplanes lichenis]|uniref:hypothetical protein n=1 Tax=Symbioplanes lichenis TaxID=1629072 RepID=UPI0027397165|nr:hypothetical protein [Actinoplanes lichenis]